MTHLSATTISRSFTSAGPPAPTYDPAFHNDVAVRSDPFASVKSHFFDTSSWGAFCDVTLTLKQTRQSDNGAWIKIDDYYTQISITLTAILTEIAFLFAISNSLPKVPYLTFIDAFFLMSFLFSCLCMAELVAVHQFREWDQSEHGERLRRVSQLLYPAIYAALVAGVALIFLGRPAFH